MKKIILSLAIIAAAVGVNAQDQKSEKAFRVGVGVNGGLPIASIKDFSSLAIGGDVQGEYSSSEDTRISLSGGYLKFVAKNGATTSGLIPVLAGFKYLYGESFYGHVQAGVTLATESGVGSAFTYSASVGHRFNEHFGVAAKYWASTKQSFISAYLGIRVGYTF